MSLGNDGVLKPFYNYAEKKNMFFRAVFSAREVILVFFNDQLKVFQTKTKCENKIKNCCSVIICVVFSELEWRFCCAVMINVWENSGMQECAERVVFSSGFWMLGFFCTRANHLFLLLKDHFRKHLSVDVNSRPKSLQKNCQLNHALPSSNYGHPKKTCVQ